MISIYFKIVKYKELVFSLFLVALFTIFDYIAENFGIVDLLKVESMFTHISNDYIEFIAIYTSLLVIGYLWWVKNANYEKLEERKVFVELLLDLTAHDIRNYIQITQSNSELLETLLHPSDQKDLIQDTINELQYSIKNTTLLINNIHLLNRLVSGKFDLRPITINPLLYSAIETVLN